MRKQTVESVLDAEAGGRPEWSVRLYSQLHDLFRSNFELIQDALEQISSVAISSCSTARKHSAKWTARRISCGSACVLLDGIKLSISTSVRLCPDLVVSQAELYLQNKASETIRILTTITRCTSFSTTKRGLRLSSMRACRLVLSRRMRAILYAIRCLLLVALFIACLQTCYCACTDALTIMPIDSEKRQCRCGELDKSQAEAQLDLSKQDRSLQKPDCSGGCAAMFHRMSEDMPELAIRS